MKGFFKKSISMVLALMMVLSMFTGMIFTANAETAVTFDTIEENFDGETVNPLFEGFTVQDGKLVLAAGQDIVFGEYTNYVFEADVIFKGIVGKKSTATSGNTFKFIFGKHDVRYYSNMSVYNAVSGAVEYHRLKWDETPVVGTAVSSKTTDSTGKNYIGWVVTEVADVHGDGVMLPVKMAESAEEGAATKVLQHNTMVVDELIPNLGFQTHCTACGSNPATTALGAGTKINPANADDVVRFRVEVFGNQLTIKAYYNDTMYGVQRTINAKNGGDYTKGVFKVGGFTDGAVAILDNIKFADLDSAKANGEIEGATLSTTTLTPGTPDNDTGIVYGGEVEVDVFGEAMTLSIGEDLTIAADGYDYNKAGIRKNATLMAGDQVFGTYDITYRYGDFIEQTIDFADGQVPSGWTNSSGTIADGKLTFNGAGNLKFNTGLEDFAMEYDYTQTLLDTETKTNYLVTHYFWKNGNNGVELSPWMDNRGNGNGFKWRLMLRNGGTAYTAKVVTSAVNTSLVSGTTYHVEIHAVDGIFAVKITDTSTETVVMNGQLDVPSIDANAATAGTITLAGLAGIKAEFDNIKLTNLKNTADQTPYALTLSEDASLVFDPADASITATGTAAAKFYGFKPESTIVLADVTDEMVYVGNNTVLWGDFELPCTLLKKDAGSTAIDFESEELPAGWTTTETFATQDGKYYLHNGNQNSLKYALTYDDYIVEYDITPYLLQYITGSVASIQLPGSGNVRYEVAVYYDNYSTATMKPEAYNEATFPEVGDTASKLGAYAWRLYDRGAAKPQALKNEGDMAPVSNSVVTTLSPETNEAFAEKLAFEESTTYRVRIEMIGSSIKVKVAIKGEDEINWTEVDYLAGLKRNDRVAADGTVTFTCNMDDLEVLIDNITIQEVVSDVTIAGYEADTQALTVGASEEDIDTSFKAVLSNGVKYDMPANLVTDVTGFDGSKAGKQTVTLHYGENEIAKDIIVKEEIISVFENFSGYENGKKLDVDGNQPIDWNSNTVNTLTAVDGSMYGVANNALINNGEYKSVEGTLSVDVCVPAIDVNTSAPKTFVLSKFEGPSIGFAIATTTDKKAYALLSYSTAQNGGDAGILTKNEIDFSFGQWYRMELRVYGNTVKALLDGETVVSYVMGSDHPMYSFLTTKSARWGFFNNGESSITEALELEKIVGNHNFYFDNVIKTSYAANTYTVDGSAVNVTNALPTKAQAGDKVVVSADVQTTGQLLANGAPILQNANGFGGNGTDFYFTMPAQNVTITAGDAVEKIATVATSIREDKSAVRFLNRLFLPAVKDEEGNAIALELGDITEFGALILPTKLLEGDLTAETARAYKAVAYNAEKFVRYDVTGKYVDYVVAVNSKDLEREFTCVAYYVVNGEYVYGEAVAQSINGWLAQ